MVYILNYVTDALESIITRLLYSAQWLKCLEIWWTVNKDTSFCFSNILTMELRHSELHWIIIINNNGEDGNAANDWGALVHYLIMGAVRVSQLHVDSALILLLIRGRKLHKVRCCQPIGERQI